VGLIWTTTNLQDKSGECRRILEARLSISEDIIVTSFKVLASLTRRTGLRTISCGIGLMKKATKRMQLILKKTT
jgi:hypothetical protein